MLRLCGGVLNRTKCVACSDTSELCKKRQQERITGILKVIFQMCFGIRVVLTIAVRQESSTNVCMCLLSTAVQIFRSPCW
jgi:hypothetical protein